MKKRIRTKAKFGIALTIALTLVIFAIVMPAAFLEDIVARGSDMSIESMEQSKLWIPDKVRILRKADLGSYTPLGIIKTISVEDMKREFNDVEITLVGETGFVHTTISYWATRDNLVFYNAKANGESIFSEGTVKTIIESAKGVSKGYLIYRAVCITFSIVAAFGLCAMAVSIGNSSAYRET